MSRPLVLVAIAAFMLTGAFSEPLGAGRRGESPEGPRREIQGADASEMATCAWWTLPIPGSSPTSGPSQVYRLAFAQGVVFGMDGDVWRVINDYRSPLMPTNVLGLVNTFLPGYRTLLAKPALMQEAFDAKCSDYRNSAVWLPKLGFLVVLEMGGIKPERIEAALQVLRRTRIPAGRDLVDALLGQ